MVEDKSRKRSELSEDEILDLIRNSWDEMDEELFRRKLSVAMDRADRRKRFPITKWALLVGLLLSIAGTAIIWIDSQSILKAMSEIVIPVGVVKDVLVEESQIGEFKQNLQEASNLDIKGFVLLMLGFFVQLLVVALPGKRT